MLATHSFRTSKFFSTIARLLSARTSSMRLLRSTEMGEADSRWKVKICLAIRETRATSSSADERYFAASVGLVAGLLRRKRRFVIAQTHEQSYVPCVPSPRDVHS